MGKIYNKDTELLIDLLIGALEEEGYEVVKYSDSKKHFTTSYDTIVIKRFDEEYFRISIDKEETYVNPRTNKIHLKNETFDDIKKELENE